jgi:S-adenosylmethionine decarboxylase
MERPGGTLIIADLSGVEVDVLQATHPCNAESAFRIELASWFAAARVTCLSYVAHSFGAPGAFTLMCLLSESHLSIHTWPEAGKVYIDAFTCGDSDTQGLMTSVVQFFEPTDVVWRVIKRD